MSIPDDQLKRQGPTIIMVDRECIDCGYNLRGLKIGGVCPECGRSIEAKKSAPRYSDQLVQAPIGWLEAFSIGALLMFLAALGLVVMTIALLFYSGPAMILIIGFIGLAWFAGVWLVTRPRPMLAATVVNTRLEWSGARVAARLTQACWPLASIGILLAVVLRQGAAPGAAVGVAAVCGSLLALVALGGLAPLCVMLARIADWAEDSSLAQGFRGSASTLGVCGLIIGLAVFQSFTGVLSGFLGGFLGVVQAGFFVLLAFIPPAYFLLCLFRLQHMARWAVWNHVAAEAKLDRFKARAAANASIGAPPPTSTPLPSPRKAASPAARSRH